MPAAATDASEGIDGAQVVAASLTDRGTLREANEDACGMHVEGASCALVVVADGVSGYEGGEVASRMAVDVTIRAFREAPASWGPLKRVYRAAQQANIEIHDRALVVTELRGMSTTLTAVVVQDGMLHAAHVGDTRLYLARDGKLVQKTKDHTLAGERARIGLGMREKGHPDRSTLTHSLGRELIAAIDRISFPLLKDDVLLVCTDGLYNVLDDAELFEHLARGPHTAETCRSLLDAANARGTPDNLTAAVLRIGVTSARPRAGWRSVFGRLLGR
ncbi:MAG TPA: protein phosphatase 2C domain-containing protein [Polyangiaceae bacterium]|nr:protein phosphatase 2C domain-containing protein [Polyangiaceae bacterium]